MKGDSYLIEILKYCDFDITKISQSIDLIDFEVFLRENGYYYIIIPEQYESVMFRVEIFYPYKNGRLIRHYIDTLENWSDARYLSISSLIKELKENQ